MTDADPWEVLEEIEHVPHLTVWFAVLKLEADDVERINLTPTRETVAEITGKIRTRKSILISLERLTEAGVLESSEMKDWRGVRLADDRTRPPDRRSVRQGVGPRP